MALMKRNLSSAEGEAFGYHPKMGGYPDLYNHLGHAMKNARADWQIRPSATGWTLDRSGGWMADVAFMAITLVFLTWTVFMAVLLAFIQHKQPLLDNVYVCAILVFFIAGIVFLAVAVGNWCLGWPFLKRVTYDARRAQQT